MSQERKAIVLAINLGRKGEMHPDEANITKHIQYAEEHGAVYFDYKWKVAEEKRRWVPMTGYLYIGRNVPDVPPERRGTISYRMVVEKILTREELWADKKERKTYVPRWRSQCLKGEWDDGRPHEPSPTWIKVSHISILSRGYSPREMGINADFVRSRVYIDDRDWK